MCLHSNIGQESTRKFGVGYEVELVLLVAIGVRIVAIGTVEVEIAETEGVTLVGVSVQVLGIDIISIQLHALAEALPDPESGTAVERFGGTGRIRNAKCWKRLGSFVGRTAGIDVAIRRKDQIRRGAANIGIDEVRQMDCLGNGQVNVTGPAVEKFLLISHIGRVDARVCVIFSKNSDTAAAGDRSRR